MGSHRGCTWIPGLPGFSILRKPRWKETTRSEQLAAIRLERRDAFENFIARLNGELSST